MTFLEPRTGDSELNYILLILLEVNYYNCNFSLYCSAHAIKNGVLIDEDDGTGVNYLFCIASTIWEHYCH